MNIRLYNARILTMEPGREVFYGEVWVKNDKIAYVAEQKELADCMQAWGVSLLETSSPELRGISNWIARETF